MYSWRLLAFYDDGMDSIIIISMMILLVILLVILLGTIHDSIVSRLKHGGSLTSILYHVPHPTTLCMSYERAVIIRTAIGSLSCQLRYEWGLSVDHRMNVVDDSS
jgi:hypothetical protein